MFCTGSADNEDSWDARRTEVDDEATVVVGDLLLDRLAAEVEMVSNDLCATRLASGSREFACPLCPWRSFGSFRVRLQHHISGYHTRLTQYVCSGTKQMKVIAALWDHDSLLRVSPGNFYLRRSAEILRESVKPPLSATANSIDKDIRLVLTNTGPVYMSKAFIDASTDTFRRARNIYYTREFAEMLRGEVLMHNARVRSFQPRLAIRAMEAGNSLASLYPSKVADWWPVIEDIFLSPAAKALRESLLAELARREEFESLSVDATMRVALTILGQEHPRCSSGNEAFSSQDCLRRVLTVRGRTGAVVAMVPIPRETAGTYAEALANCIPTSSRELVRFIATDDPSPLLWTSMRDTFPNLSILCLDTVHLPIVYECSTWGRTTAGSSFLRRIMTKFTSYDGSLSASTWGEPYTGYEDSVVISLGSVFSRLSASGDLKSLENPCR